MGYMIQQYYTTLHVVKNPGVSRSLSPSHNSIEPSKVTSRKPRVQTLTLESSCKRDFVFDISLNAVL